MHVIAITAVKRFILENKKKIMYKYSQTGGILFLKCIIK